MSQSLGQLHLSDNALADDWNRQTQSKPERPPHDPVQQRHDYHCRDIGPHVDRDSGQVWFDSLVSTALHTLPDDIDALKAALLAERTARCEFEALETAAVEDEASANQAAADKVTVRPFTRAKPVRAPLPAHLPRERVVLPAPTSCPCCGGKLVKLGEAVTETLESILRRYKVIQTVREKFSCRTCETITQPPAPFHPIVRGRAGPDLLATIMHAKFGEHQPLNRQSERFAREGIDLSVSTLADWVGACTTALSPLVTLIHAHVLAAERIHGDDTTVPVLARGKTITGRLWIYVRDDRPFGGPS